jgi:CBS domain-containing protein
VSEIMSTPPATINAASSLQSAVELMWVKKVGSVIVVDQQGRVSGLITEKDVIYAAAKGMLKKKEEPSAETIMAKNVVCVKKEDDLKAVIEKMRAHNLKHMPVVDNDNRPIGMVSLRDVLDVSITVLRLLMPPDGG